MTSSLPRLPAATCLVLLVPGLTLAAGSAVDSDCAGPLDAPRAVRCALGRSPEVIEARLELSVVAGRRTTAGTLLPSHPELSGTLARRTTPGASGGLEATNWSVTLAQEIELPGKRATRLAETDAQRIAALRRLAAAEQDVAAATSSALYSVAVADEAMGLVMDLERGARSLETVMTARAAEGLTPPVDADLAAAESVRLSITRLEVERRRASARARLAAFLGLASSARLPALAPTTLGITPASLAPSLTSDSLVARALAVRADLAAVAAERQVASARVQRARRQRLPNLVLSVFAERDGFDERVLGGGLTIPLVLPAPLGPSGRGEIQEAEARRDQAEQQLEGARRRVREEVSSALAAWQARRAAVERYTPALVTRARQHVLTLAEAIQNRQLSPREALLAQRTFIELLQSHLEARLAEALAAVELMKAAALPLPGVQP